MMKSVKSGAIKAVAAVAAAGMIMCASPVMAEEAKSETTGISFELPESWYASDLIDLEVDDEALDMDRSIVHMSVALFPMSQDQLEELSDRAGEGDEEAEEQLKNNVYRLLDIIGVKNGMDKDNVFTFLNEKTDGSFADMIELASSGTHTYYLMQLNESAVPQPAEPESEETKAAVEAVIADLQTVIDSMTFSDIVVETQAGKEVSFETTDLDGNPVSSADLFAQNKITMVNLWFRGCPHCVGELADLEQINQQLQEKGCAVVGMTIDDDEVIPEAKAVLEENGVTYTNLRAPADYGTLFPTQGFPTTYFVDQSGKIVGSAISGPDVERYVPHVEELLAEMEGGEDAQEDEFADVETGRMMYGSSAVKNIVACAKDAAADPFKITVKDEDGNPVEGVMIQFCTDMMCNMQTTGADGTVSFDRTSKAECHVHVLKAPEGFAKDDTEYPAKIDESELEIVLKK